MQRFRSLAFIAGAQTDSPSSPPINPLYEQETLSIKNVAFENPFYDFRKFTT
jgi:hypothetical protein